MAFFIVYLKFKNKIMQSAFLIIHNLRGDQYGNGQEKVSFENEKKKVDTKTNENVMKNEKKSHKIKKI